MTGTGEQRAADGKVERESAEAVPARHSAAGIDYIVKKRHVASFPP
jgi:hypothetical protein